MGLALWTERGACHFLERRQALAAEEVALWEILRKKPKAPTADYRRFVEARSAIDRGMLTRLLRNPAL